MAQPYMDEWASSNQKKHESNDYASEKRNFYNIFESAEKHAEKSERIALKLEIMKMALECTDPVKDAEAMYQWITKPE